MFNMFFTKKHARLILSWLLKTWLKTWRPIMIRWHFFLPYLSNPVNTQQNSNSISYLRSTVTGHCTVQNLVVRSSGSTKVYVGQPGNNAIVVRWASKDLKSDKLPTLTPNYWSQVRSCFRLQQLTGNQYLWRTSRNFKLVVCVTIPFVF